MLHSERVIRLKRLRILEKLSDDALQSVAGKCKWRSYAAGEQILGHGDTSTDVSSCWPEVRVRSVIHAKARLWSLRI